MPDHDAPPGLLTSSGAGLAPPGTPAESDFRSRSPRAADLPSTEPYNPEEPPGWYEGLGALPLGYGDDHLVCMPRDPTTAFVYWDLSQHLVARSFEGLSRARAVLKLIHLSGETLREAEIDLSMRSFYLRELPPGAWFRVELWATGAGGARLLRSARPVFLPPAEASDLLDEQYLHIWFDAPLSGTTLAIATRPQHWRAAADFPGWSHGAAGARSPVPEGRLSYPGLTSGAGKLTGAKS